MELANGPRKATVRWEYTLMSPPCFGIPSSNPMVSQEWRKGYEIWVKGLVHVSAGGEKDKFTHKQSSSTTLILIKCVYIHCIERNKNLIQAMQNYNFIANKS